jgi:hypothetical protein
MGPLTGQIVTGRRHRGVPGVARGCSLQRRDLLVLQRDALELLADPRQQRGVHRPEPTDQREESSRDASSSPDATRLKRDQAAPPAPTRRRPPSE